MRGVSVIQSTSMGVVVLGISMFFGVGIDHADALPVKILSDSRHSYSTIISAVNYFLGVGHVGTDVIVHSTNLGTSGPFSANLSKALDTGVSYYDESGVLVPSQAPYDIFTQSSTGYPGDTRAKYDQFSPNDVVHNWAYTGLSAGALPPTLHSAPGGGGWSSGYGVEWSLPAAYGFNGTLSDLTAASSGMMASLRYLHPTWNNYDVKAAIRQTASNWSTGYDSADYGFGTADFSAANALVDGAIALQPPAVKATTLTGRHLRFEVYPFKQSRRVREVLFHFPSSPGFSSDELSLTDIESLGGVKQAEYSGDASRAEVIVDDMSDRYFVWFSADHAEDSLANFSRIETYSVLGPLVQSDVDVLGPGETTSLLSVISSARSIAVDASSRKAYAVGNSASGSVFSVARFDSGDGVTTLGANLETFDLDMFDVADIAVDGSMNKVYVIVYDSDISDWKGLRFDSGDDGTTFGANLETFGLGLHPKRIAIDPANNKIYLTGWITPYGDSQVARFDSGGGGTTLGANLETFDDGGTTNFTGIALDVPHSTVYIGNSSNRLGKFDSGENGTTFGDNFVTITNSQTNSESIAVDTDHNKIYAIGPSDARAFMLDSGGGGTTFGSNPIAYGNLDYGDAFGETTFSEHRFDNVSGALYGISDDATFFRIVPSIRKIHQKSSVISNEVIDCSGGTAGDIGAYVLPDITGVSLNNVTFMNCSKHALYLDEVLASASNILFSDNASSVQDAAGGYSCASCFDDEVDGDALIGSDGAPNFDSPVIDAGTTVSGRTSDSLGNPIYGSPDVGAIEYQPPYVMGTDEVTTSAAIRLYGDEKFRNKSSPSGGDTADMIVTIPGTDRSEWLDLDISEWSLTGTRDKTWTESTTGSIADTVHTVGDLEPGGSYAVSVDGVRGRDISGCAEGICQADGNGRIAFTYTGGYSTHTFEVEGGVDIDSPILSEFAPSGTLPSDTTLIALSVTTDEAAMCKYSAVSGTAFSSMTAFVSTGSTAHTQNVSVSSGQSYAYFVRCADSSDNVSSESTISFSVSVIAEDDENADDEDDDEDALEISSLKSISTSDSITITWNTNRSATSQVKYGFSADGMTDRKKDSHRTKKHRVTLKELRSNTDYFLRVSSEDGDGREDSNPYVVVRTKPADALLWHVPKKLPIDENEDAKVTGGNDEVETSSPSANERSVTGTERIGRDAAEKTVADASEMESRNFFDTSVAVKDGRKQLSLAKFQIIDPKSGNPIPDLPVTIHSDPQEAVTDADGIATFHDVPIGKHALSFAYHGVSFEKGVVLGDAVSGEGPIRAEIIEIRAEREPRPWWEWAIVGTGIVTIIALIIILMRLKISAASKGM